MNDSIYNKFVRFGFQTIRFLLAFSLLGLGFHFGFFRRRGSLNNVGIFGDFGLALALMTLGFFLFYRCGMWIGKLLLLQKSNPVDSRHKTSRLQKFRRGALDLLSELLLIFLVAVPMFVGIVPVDQSVAPQPFLYSIAQLAAPFCIYGACISILSEKTPFIL